MSYLSLPRVTFAGTFQADTNTVNNDVRHYDNATFEANFQKLQRAVPGTPNMVFNGWWNPDGTNAFRLLDCIVSGAVGEDGTADSQDCVHSLQLNAQLGGTAAKIVDLDPYIQMASALWGMRIALTDGAKVVMSAELETTSFRDLYFGRLSDGGQTVQGSPGASARFTGKLKNIYWDASAQKSGVLAALQRRAQADGGDGLTLSLLTYGYQRDPTLDDRTFGVVVGTLGWREKSEPAMFAPGRRFAPIITDPSNPFSNALGFGYMNAAVSGDRSVATVDLGMALPLQRMADKQIELQDFGPIKVVVMKNPDTVVNNGGKLVVTTGSAEGPVTADQYELVGTVADYAISNWLMTNGGIVDFANISAAARTLLVDHPLALVISKNGAEQIVVRETAGGIWLRADDFVHRVDTVTDGWVDASATLYAMQYGLPFDKAPIAVSLGPRGQPQVGGSLSNEVNAPQAPVNDMNFPPECVYVSPALTSNAAGEAVVSFDFADPGNPRHYIDGQIYEFHYGFAADATGGLSSMPLWETIVFHVRDAFDPPAVPSWATDLAPIFVQYANLYPAMSRGLFNFADYSTVAAHAQVLLFAFTRPIEDPNYMPVSRDLSSGKIAMITNWLSGFLPEPQATLPPIVPARTARAQPQAHLSPPNVTPSAASTRKFVK